MKKQQPLVVKRGTAEFTLTRIDDRALAALSADAVEVEEDHLLWMEFNSVRREPRPLGLPQFFLMMCQRFGDSGVAFDDYKSSFCFAFRMATSKLGRTGDYLFVVTDWKGGLRMRLFRRGAGSDSRNRPSIAFVDEEFSRDDFRFLVGFLEGYLESLEQVYHERLAAEAPDFLHEVESGLVLYGYKGGRPFLYEFEDDEEFGSMCVRLRKELGNWKVRLAANLEWHRPAHSMFTIPTIAKELSGEA